MTRRPLCVSLGLIVALAIPAAAQVPPDKALQTFTVSDGLEIQLWASEPLFVNPTCMDIDHLGRVWVCESINYRCKLRNQPLRRPEGDRILILEDSKGTGKADKVTVFYQAPEILAPLGIAVAKDPVGPGYKVYVCQSPDILVFEDKDGDGKADGPPKKLLTGFRGYDHDHGVHGILIGPDGKLYFSVGDQGVQNLQSSDGKGRKWTTNQTDCQAGTIWRCDLDGKNLELLAHNFRNEYEPCVDSFGTIFVSDNDDDGNQQTRICYVMPGGNYGYWPRGPGQSHWHEEQPGVVPKILRTYFGSPTGMCVYEGTLLPKKYWGQLLHTDAGPRHLRCYHLKSNGAGYDVEREDMVQSTDNWFRPSDVCVAPDGSVFIADWYDPGVGGHGMGDVTRGRIYRVVPKGHKGYVAPKVDLENEDGIFAAFVSPALSVRHMANEKLATMERLGAGTVLRRALHPTSPLAVQARASRHAQRLFGNRTKTVMVPVMREWDEKLRINQLRILKDSYGQYAASVEEIVKETPAVRREFLLNLRDMDPVFARDFVPELAKQYDGKDRFYLEAIGIAVGHHDKARRDVILADFDKHFPEWNDKVADLVWELRPPQVLPRLEKLLVESKLTPTQRGRIVDILAAADDQQAGVSLVKLLQRDLPEGVREHVLTNLRQFLPGKWRDLRNRPELTEAIKQGLTQPEQRGTALELIAAADRTDLAGEVAALARDNKAEAALRARAVRTLGALHSAEAVSALDALLTTAPAPLRQEAVQALGQLLGQRRKDLFAQAMKPLQRVVLATDQDLALRHAAVAALAGSQPGTVWLLDLHQRKELPEALKAETGRLLRNSPYQGLRNRAMLAFPPPGRLDPSKLPSIPVLAARKGDPARGKQLLAASAKNDLQCLKCHTVQGTGGNVGPDLSVIGKKASRENLIESILYPSKAIADQYVNWVIETKAGVVLTGLIVEETPESVTLRDANAKDTRISKKEIESRGKSPNSLMPSDLLAYMTEDDVLDLVEYLFTLKSPALALDYWHIAGPFDNGVNDEGLNRVFPPEKAIDLSATYPGKSGTVRWRRVQPDAQGYVDLRTFLGNESVNAVSYVFRDIESPADQEARILLGTDDGAKLWVNGALVFTSRLHRAAAPEQEAVTVKLKKGRNRLLLKIDNGDGAHGFYLTVLAEQELKRVEGR
jgi:putative membrane-bound dehydrogenase-like protein